MELNQLDPDLFVSKVKSVCAEAKEATIQLLKSQGDKCFVVNFEDNLDFETGNGTFIVASALGVDPDKGLVVGGTSLYDNGTGGFDIEGYNPAFRSTDEVTSHSEYPKLYAFVVRNLEKSYTCEETEKLLKEHTDE